MKTFPDNLWLSGDEDGGVSLNCRDCDRGGLPVAYHGTAGHYGRDGDVVQAATVDALLDAGRRHVTAVHDAGQPPSTARIPDLIRVERVHGRRIRIYVDGREFPYCTVDGGRVQTHVRRDETPAVTVTMPAMRVEVVDEL